MEPKRITIHCSDSPNGKYFGVNEIREWHRARGFHDIGYHFVVVPDGSIQEGRPTHVQGAHVENENENNLGICLVGKDKFTSCQFESLRHLLNDLTNRFGINKGNIYCHYQFDSARAQGKTCPNIPINAVLAWFLTGDHDAIKEYCL